MSTTSTTQAFSIDVLHDLESSSALKTLLTSEQNAVFSLAGQVLQYASVPVKEAATAKLSVQLTLKAPASWTLPNGIIFSLSASASCKVSIDTVSETFSISTMLDSSDTTDITAGPATGIAYINIDLDFSILGIASASGSFNGLGIAGTASGGRSATVTFCQPVNDSTNTIDAIRQAFSQIVFPFDPSSLPAMQTGTLSRVVFDGTFSAELDVTFGLGDHIFAAPSVEAALASAQNVASITSPSIEINAGATGTVTYTHTDHFALVIDKSTTTVATIYLIRALESDASLKAGFNASITTMNVSVAIDQTALQSVVKQVTKSDILATAVVNTTSIPLNNLVTNLNAKLASWASDVTGEIGLTASLARQKNRTALLVFDADLASPDLTQKSFTALIYGNIKDALNAGGLNLQPGSGVSESLKRSAAIHFQFFNLFKFDSVSDFFSNATSELGPDGTIRLHAAVGDETKSATSRSFSSFRIYFVVAANSDATGALTHTGVDLRLELSEASRQRSGATFADTLALAPAQPDTNAAQRAITSYLGGNPKGNLTLIYDIKPSAYANLRYSPFTNGKPGPLPQAADLANWTAFQAATTRLISDLSSLSSLNYGNWVAFNRAATDGPNSTANPDRRHTGVIAQGNLTLLDNAARASAGYFLQASQGFMNLCEDLATLATSATQVTDLTAYNDLLAFITQIIAGDVFPQYGVPTAAALVHLCGTGTTQVASSIQRAPNNTSLTCTVTLT